MKRGLAMSALFILVGLSLGLWLAQCSEERVAEAAPIVGTASPLDWCSEPKRKLDRCMAANNQFLEKSAEELAKISRSCGKCSSTLARFLSVDVYTEFRPDHPACERLRAARIVLPKECRSWEDKRLRVVD